MGGMSLNFVPSPSKTTKSLDKQIAEAKLDPFDSSDKSKCRRLTALAIKEGLLVRPNNCSRCGIHSDIAGTIQAHHSDYSKPLDIEWYCSVCHEQVESEVAMRQIQVCDEIISDSNKVIGSANIVGIYTRISPNPYKDDTENQDRQLMEYVARRGWRIAATYREIHVSGSKSINKRPQFKRMMEDARQHKFQLLLFWALDRFCREGIYETMTYLRQLKSWGIGYKSYTEQEIDSTGLYGELILAVMATLAKQERVRLVERINAGIQTARLRGIKLGRPKLISDPTRIAAMSEMRKNGYSIRQIADKMGISVASVGRMVKEMNLGESRPTDRVVLLAKDSLDASEDPGR